MNGPGQAIRRVDQVAGDDEIAEKLLVALARQFGGPRNPARRRIDSKQASPALVLTLST